jgi:hypothetical protein
MAARQRGKMVKCAEEEISHISTNKIRKGNYFWIPVVEIAINLFKKFIFCSSSPAFTKSDAKVLPLSDKIKKKTFTAK